MKSRHRVHAALARQPVDRVPVFVRFHPSTAQRLAPRLEIPVAPVGQAPGNDVASQPVLLTNPAASRRARAECTRSFAMDVQTAPVDKRISIQEGNE